MRVEWFHLREEYVHGAAYVCARNPSIGESGHNRPCVMETVGGSGIRLANFGLVLGFFSIEQRVYRRNL